MKKIIAGFLGLIAVLFIGCANGVQRYAVETVPVDVNVVLETEDVEVLLDSDINVKGGVPEISQLSWVDRQEGYTKIFSGLSVSDVTRTWNDWMIFSKVGIKNITVMINSPGGDAFSGLALASMVLHFRTEYGMNIKMLASGIVASAAVPIFASGTPGERYALSSTIFMVHEAALWKWPGRETSSDIRSQGELMDLLGNRYRRILEDTTGTKADDWLNMEARTSWFSCEKGRELGLVDICK